MSENKSVNPPIAKSEEQVRTPTGRLIYPHLFKLDEVAGKFTAFLAVDPDAPGMADFKAKVAGFGKKAFGDDRPENLTWPIIDGDKWADNRNKPITGAVREAVRGKVMIKLSSVYPPTVSYPEDGKLVNVMDKAGEAKVYMGCKAAATVTLAAFRGRYPAVVCWMSQVARVGAGEKIGGVDPNKAFGDLVDKDEALPANEGPWPAKADLDDEIPFD